MEEELDELPTSCYLYGKALAAVELLSDFCALHPAEASPADLQTLQHYAGMCQQRVGNIRSKLRLREGQQPRATAQTADA